MRTRLVIIRIKFREVCYDVCRELQQHIRCLGYRKAPRELLLCPRHSCISLAQPCSESLHKSFKMLPWLLKRVQEWMIKQTNKHGLPQGTFKAWNRSSKLTNSQVWWLWRSLVTFNQWESLASENLWPSDRCLPMLWSSKWRLQQTFSHSSKGKIMQNTVARGGK